MELTKKNTGELTPEQNIGELTPKQKKDILISLARDYDKGVFETHEEFAKALRAYGISVPWEKEQKQTAE